jgi:phage tail-like protein
VVDLSWVLTLDAEKGRPALSATASTASGLEITWTYGTPLADDVREGRLSVGQFPGDVTPLRLAAGSSETLRTWQAWADSIEGFHDSCGTDMECARLWKEGTLHRDGSLSLETQDGEVLATWRLVDTWPSALVTAGTGEGSIPELALVATVAEFSFGADSAKVLDLFGSAPRPVPVPNLPETEEPAEWDAYGEAVQGFAAGYHAPRGAIDRLNALVALRQQNQSDLDFLERFADEAPSFRLVIDGYELASFSELQGISTQVEVVDSLFEGEPDQSTLKRPGRTKYSNIVLKRGFTGDSSLFEWYASALAKPKTPKTITVCLPPGGSTVSGCAAAAEVKSWNFYNAWPARYEATTAAIGTQANAIAVEELVLTHEGWNL